MLCVVRRPAQLMGRCPYFDAFARCDCGVLRDPKPGERFRPTLHTPTLELSGPVNYGVTICLLVVWNQATGESEERRERLSRRLSSRSKSKRRLAAAAFRKLRITSKQPSTATSTMKISPSLITTAVGEERCHTFRVGRLYRIRHLAMWCRFQGCAAGCPIARRADKLRARQKAQTSLAFSME